MKKIRKYESLTKFIPDLEKGDFGDWTEQTGDGTPEKPLEFCHIEYSKPVRQLIDTLFRFGKEHKEMELFRYPEIMDEIYDRQQEKDLSDIDVSVLDGRLIIGFLLAEISMCRFSDSIFLDLCKAGTVLRCLKRLKEIDETGEDAVSVADSLPEGPYPIPVRDLIRGEVCDEYIMQGEGEILDIDYGDYEYTVTADDLLTGIRNMMKKPQIAEQWAEEVLFCDEEIWPEEEENEKAGRLLAEESAVLCAWKELNDLRFNPDDDNDEPFVKQMAEAEAVLQAWLDIGGDPTRAEEYPDAMLRWIVADDDEDSIDRRNAKRQDTFVKCLDELCRRGDVGAVTKRGYCYYCGTKPYPQNWEAARDAFIWIYGKTGEAWPANTLGYIYYYGRCNGGAPEYEEAFRWFSIGHAGGMEESTYKLGDLFANGFGRPKNGGIAYNLYQGVYKETLGFLLDGSVRGKFADAAIRMGNCYRDGLGVSVNPEKAYGYYLQARMALKKRMEAGSYFGDESVKSRLDETMEKMREVYTDRAKTMRTAAPVWLDWILDESHRTCRMTWDTSKDGKISMYFTRVPDSFSHAVLILATFPAADYCDLVRGVTVETEKNAELTIRNDKEEIIFDDYDWFGADNRLELLRGGETVARIRTKEFRCIPARRKSGKNADDSDIVVRRKSDLEIVKIVWKGKEEKFPPQAKQPLRVSPAHKRRLKAYKDISEFQDEYPTKAEREKFVRKLRNYEIDELTELCHTIQGKSYYENRKKKEKIFEFTKRLALRPFDECRLTVYDGSGSEKYAEYGQGLPEKNAAATVRISIKEIRAIQAVIEDNVLFETEYMEDPYNMCILDGTEYQFFFAVKGCENEMYGENIEDCREDYDHCMHSAHAIRALEEIRDILVPAGVPEQYFEL